MFSCCEGAFSRIFPSCSFSIVWIWVLPRPVTHYLFFVRKIGILLHNWIPLWRELEVPLKWVISREHYSPMLMVLLSPFKVTLPLLFPLFLIIVIIFPLERLRVTFEGALSPQGELILLWRVFRVHHVSTVQTYGSPKMSPRIFALLLEVCFFKGRFLLIIVLFLAALFQRRKVFWGAGRHFWLNFETNPSHYLYYKKRMNPNA